MAQTYKWVDQNGVVSYSQTPPPSIPVEIIDIQPPPAADVSDGKEELKRLRQQSADNWEDLQQEKEAQRKAQAAEEIRKKNCTAARSNLEKLLNSSNRMMQTADGDYLRLTESERQQRIQTAREQIEANCKKQQTTR
jgi:hypothetical protein